MNQQHQYQKFLVACGGFYFFQYIYTAAKIGLFDIDGLQNGSTLKKISKTLEISEKSSQILLQGLVSIDVLERKKNLYYCPMLFKNLLSIHSDESLFPMLEAYHYFLYPSGANFLSSIKSNQNLGLKLIPGSGKTLYNKIEKNKKLQKIFYAWMARLGKNTWETDEIYKIISPVLSKSKLVFDCGGGDATNLIKLHSRFPNIKGVVFDLPGREKSALKSIRSAKLENQIVFQPGNFSRTSFTKEADTFILSHIINMNSPQKNILLLKKIFRSLPANGNLIILNSTSDNDKNLGSAILSGYFLSLASGEGMVYKSKDLEIMLKKSGFNKIRIFHTKDHSRAIFIAQKNGTTSSKKTP